VSTTTKERPITFDAESVRAILAGTKTRTRRVVKPQPLILDSGGAWYPEGNHPKARHYANGEHLRKGLAVDFAPYQPGDRLWCITILPVRGYEGTYGSGDDGRIYRVDRPSPVPLKATNTSKGYGTVTLSLKSLRTTALVHRLVCESFYDPPPPGMSEVRHLDGDRSNNSPENLDWGTPGQNRADRSSMGRGERQEHHSAKFTPTEIEYIRESECSQRDLAKLFDVSQSTISSIKSGKTWGPLPDQPPPNMPRWASRITLEIVSVRVERVQEITMAGVVAEGFEIDAMSCHCGAALRGHSAYDGHSPTPMDDPISGTHEGFAARWNAINAKQGFGWDANPWVWVVEFRRAEAE
jgi:hypothetical protein